MNNDRDDVRGEAGDDSRTAEARREEGRAWDRLVASLQGDVSGPAPTWLEGRVMAEIREMEDAPGARSWLLRRRTLRLSPLAMGLAAAAVLALAAGPWLLGRPGSVPGPGAPGTDAAGPGAAPEAVIYVRFELSAPAARSVAVSGDFNEWDPAVHALEDGDGDGVWTGRVPVRPGIHEYMFVVDGERWVTDPGADRYADDGFGNRNAVLALADPGRT